MVYAFLRKKIITQFPYFKRQWLINVILLIKHWYHLILATYFINPTKMLDVWCSTLSSLEDSLHQQLEHSESHVENAKTWPGPHWPSLASKFAWNQHCCNKSLRPCCKSRPGFKLNLFDINFKYCSFSSNFRVLSLNIQFQKIITRYMIFVCMNTVEAFLFVGLSTFCWFIWDVILYVCFSSKVI